MKTDLLIIVCKLIAILSISIGTLIFLMFLIFSNIEIGLFGLFFIIIAGITNFVNLLLLIYQFFKDKEYKKTILKVIGLILLYIPIVITYFWIAILWINTLRITFINETKVDLKNIKVTGCENRIIEELKMGQSKTVWLQIPNDCGVSIEYNINGLKKTEDVTGYVTNNGGYSMTFKIGRNQLPYDQDL